MAERHPVYADPGDPAQPATPDEADATITRVLAPTWVRRFDTYADNNGATMYVDTLTGQTYDKLPDMREKDGRTI